MSTSVRVAEEDVEGAATIDEHLPKSYVPNDRVQNKRKTPCL
jgi:hypothetical protein